MTSKHSSLIFFVFLFFLNFSDLDGKENYSSDGVTDLVSKNSSADEEDLIRASCEINFDYDITFPSCPKEKDGSITILIVEAKPPFQITLDGPILGVFETEETKFTIPNLVAGEYKIIIENRDGCVGTATIFIPDPEPFIFNSTEASPTCIGGGTGEILVSSYKYGPSPYNISWNGPGGNDGSKFGVSGNYTIQNLVAGSYSITVVDAKGCSNVNMTTVTSLGSVNVSIVGDLTFCNETGGTILSTSPSGFAKYLWSNGTTGSSLSVSSSGIYSVTVTDGNGCQGTATANVVKLPKINIDLNTNISTLEESCPGSCDGEVFIKVTGGLESKGYIYNWEGPDGFTSNLEDIKELCNGEYKLTVTDMEGCKRTFTTSIGKADGLQLSLSAQNPSCSDTNDGKVIVNFSGGIGPYMISWNGAESGSASNVSSGHNISNLSPGNYMVTITDDNGCSLSKPISIVQPSPFSFTAAEFSPSCQGSNTGSILVSNIVNGTAPYSITWVDAFGNDDNASTGSNSYTISNLISGTYDVIIKDDNGCDFVVKNIVVNEQSQINVSIIGDLVFCAGQSSGVLETNPANFSFKWSTGGTGKSITINSAGTYSVTVTDAGGCTGVDAVTVTKGDDIIVGTNVGSSQLSISCEGNCDGKISPNVSGGAGAPYSYKWTGPGGFSSTSMNISDLCIGNYSLTVTDGNGCSNSYTQVISGSSSFQVDLNPTSASCPGMADGSIETKVIGGNGPFTYLWSNGATTEHLKDIDGGTYSVTVTDSKGCTASGTKVVGEGSAINGSISPVNSTICIGESITLKASGGSNYLWSNGETTSSIEVTPVANTSYKVTISGAGNTCAVVKTAMVNVNDFSGADILISENSGLVNDDAEICEGSNITLTAIGGVSYTWTGGFANPLTVNPTADKTYTVTITDNAGCTAILSQSVIVNQRPDANIDLSDASQVIGDAQIIKNTSISNCGALSSCSWEIDGAPKSGSCNDITHTFNSAGSYEVELEVENDCGCTDTAKKTIDIFSGDACKIKLFSINNDLGEACVNAAVPIDIVVEASEGCNVAVNKIYATIDGVPVTSFNFDGETITFFEEGLYNLEYVFEDDCSCRRSTIREINVVEAPDVKFSDVNFTLGCLGEVISIRFEDFDFGEKVTIQFGDEIKTYETDIINLFLSEIGTIPLRIIRVSNSICEKVVTDQLININVIEPLKIESRSFKCDDNGLYTLTLETSGGSSSASILSTIPGVQNGDNYVISGLNPNMDFSFTMSRGEFCNPLDVYQPLVSCNCIFEPGTMKQTFFLGCAGEYYDITDVYSGSDVVNSLLDTAVYILHDGLLEKTLGKVYEVYPITQTFITNNFEDYIPNKNYILSVVGIRKFDFFNLDINDKGSLSFKGVEDCFSVSNGIPVIWHGSEISISGPDEVCGNAYNEIFVSAGIGDGAELSITIPGLTQENYTFSETDGKLYVHFVNGNELQVPIDIVATTYHSDVIYDDLYETTCVSDVNYLVNINQENISPDTSKVILWPGGIFASTDTLDNICYRWGKTTRVTNSIVEDTLFEGANERFYFADMNDVEGLNERRQIWVETYYCDDPTCVTRNIFNGEFPISFQGGRSESGMTIFPNPGRGLFNLKMNNDYIGEVGIVVYDIRGRQIHKSSFMKNGLIVNKGLDLLEIPRGVYIVSTIFGDGSTFNDKLIKH
ncbi:T9SS type A sorting domain-containing protein [Portibacter lacus]|uniref:PKD domain-containing protein n=1 Tax=Portibacter lacus TaxID=1099794 RepID=A0AA37SRM8_9BACT|nr:T9SS type A sorting domain-containing protein [Portibacter lacus]GLR16670.1 hypothetical protein GCM10007940_12850 [Portibacter lacus]